MVRAWGLEPQQNVVIPSIFLGTTHFLHLSVNIYAQNRFAFLLLSRGSEIGVHIECGRCLGVTDIGGYRFYIELRLEEHGGVGVTELMDRAGKSRLFDIALPCGLKLSVGQKIPAHGREDKTIAGHDPIGETVEERHDAHTGGTLRGL